MSAVRVRPDLAISGEHQELRSMVRELMADTSSSATLRAVMETEDGFDRATWSTLAQLGLLALLVPERYEGLGQGPVEASIVFEEMGWAPTGARTRWWRRPLTERSSLSPLSRPAARLAASR